MGEGWGDRAMVVKQLTNKRVNRGERLKPMTSKQVKLVKIPQSLHTTLKAAAAKEEVLLEQFTEDLIRRGWKDRMGATA